ncbi:hypothetical protein ACFO7V_16685 [Glutamicibacter bergerei]|uniref:Uncharacterized protein n=1 Tax=Glutamicibacter bergerei TaxID=256702 RepID=A0ABV9MQ85_9MICC|nr:hypothetical protein [Micrococcaceae bacterium]
MSKTFKSASSERKVRIWEANLGVAVCVEDPITNEATSTQIAPSDAPALALAILESAGYGEEVDTDGSPDGHVRVAKYYLYEGVKAHASITAKAKEQAELEAEALELYKAHTSYHHAKSLSETASPSRWLAVARKAREIGAKK